MARKKGKGRKKSKGSRRKKMSGVGKAFSEGVQIALGLKSADTVALVASKKLTGVNPYFIAGGEAAVGLAGMLLTKNTFVKVFGAVLFYNGVLTAIAQTGILTGVGGGQYRIPFKKGQGGADMGRMKEMNILTGSNGTANKMGQAQPSWRGVLSGLGMA